MIDNDKKNEGLIDKLQSKLNKKADNIENVRLKKYTANIKKRFKALTESQLKMLNDIYDDLDVEDKRRAKKSFNERVDAQRRALEYWKKHYDSVNKDLTLYDRFAGKVFYLNRKADLAKLSSVANKTFSDITDAGTKANKTLSKQITDITEQLRDWTTAMNVDAIKDGAEEVARSSRDLRNEVMRFSKMSKEDWAEINDQASEFSKKSGYAIDKLKYLESAKDIVVNLKLNDKGIIQQYTESLTKLKEASGGDIGSTATLVEMSQNKGMGGADYVNRMGSKMLALQQMDGSATTVEDLMNEYNDNIRKLKTLANGDATMITKYTDQMLALTTASNSSYIDGLNKELMHIMSMSMEEVGDYMQSHPGINAAEIQKMMKSGNFEDAAKKWVGDFNNLRASMISRGGVASWEQFKQSTGFDLGDINEDQVISQQNIDSFFSAYEGALDKINEQAQAQTTELDNYQPPEATWVEKTKNWFKASKFGSLLSDTLNDLDLDMMDIYFATSMLGKVGGGLKGTVSKLASSKLGTLAIGGASSLGKGLATRAGTAALSMTGGVAGGLLTNFGSATTGAVAGSKAGSLLGKLGTAGAFLSGGIDLFSGLKSKVTGEGDQDEANMNLAQGAVKVGFTAIGTLLGGPLGAMIGSAVGEFVAGFIDKDTVEWMGNLVDSAVEGVSSAWDSITGWIGNNVTWLGDQISSIWDGFTSAADSAWEGIKDIGKKALFFYIGVWDMVLDEVFGAFGMDWQSMKSDLIKGVYQFRDDLVDGWNTFVSAVSSWVTSFTNTTSALWNMFSGAAVGAWNTITSWADNQIQYVSNLASNLWTNFSSWASSAWNDIYSTAQGVWNKVTNFITSSTAYQTVTGLINKLSTLASGAGNAVMSFINKALGRGESTVNQVVDGSHKTGLDRVPFDGYIAELHKDETVLTKEQANDWHSQNDANSNGKSATDFFHQAYLNTQFDKAQLLSSYQASQQGNGSGKTGISANAATNSMGDVMKAFTTMGYSRAAAAGVVGNLYHESAHTLDPNIIQGNGRGPAAGIAQWENYNSKSDRWADLDRFAKANNSQWNNLNTQLSFIDAELKGATGTEGTTSAVLGDYGGYNAFKSLSSVEDATEIFEKAFERAGVVAMSERIQYANQALNSYDVGTPWVPNDQLALIHKGEAVVPADQNPYNNGSTVTSTSSDEVIQVLKWGFNKLEKAIKENTPVQLPSLPRPQVATDTDVAFRF